MSHDLPATDRSAPAGTRTPTSGGSQRGRGRPLPSRVAGAIALATMVLVLAACGSSYRNVSVADLAAASQNGKLVLDVRESWEYDQGHVAGAELLPLSELASRVAEVPADKPVYVYCHSGNRSKQASEILAKAGKKQIFNVQGGIIAWQAAGYPITRE